MALEALRPRLQADLNRIDDVLQPVPVEPEPAVRMKVAPAPTARPVVIEAPVAPTSGASSPVLINGKSSRRAIPALARKALDSIKSAGGSPALEATVGAVAEKALGTLDDEPGYAKVGGSGAQASLQTSSSVHAKQGDDGLASPAR